MDDGITITPEHAAFRRQKIHQNRMELYKRRFEDDMTLNHQELWAFIQHKLANDGENMYTSSSKRPSIEAEELQRVTQTLELLLDNPETPEDERVSADIALKMLRLKPLQQDLREQVLSRYSLNKVALSSHRQLTQGDALFERQLVDREFYKRAKVYSSSKKEARTLERFEQQMRSGQEQRKKNRHREFLNEILLHAKDFGEFHKKKVHGIRKKAILIKSSLESKEKKEQMAKDKEERDRIKALKENDFDKYVNMISTQKNSRLLQILEQTNKYMEQLGAKVSL